MGRGQSSMCVSVLPGFSTCGWTRTSERRLRPTPIWDWFIDHAFLIVPAQHIVGQFLGTFKEYPPRQKAASFTIDEVLQTLQQGGGK